MSNSSVSIIIAIQDGICATRPARRPNGMALSCGFQSPFPSGTASTALRVLSRSRSMSAMNSSVNFTAPPRVHHDRRRLQPDKEAGTLRRMLPVSVLDLSPITEGGDAADALRRSLDLARHAERLGYRRFWVAEHHNMPGIASAATAVVIAHVAGGTSSIRVGAGGVMLPNHAPLVVAEQFGTLESLFPGRIDLGLGRAPGTDPRTAHALRRTLASDPDAFPQDVLELLSYFEPQDGQTVRAVPGSGLRVPIFILGSSLFGAQVAAALGLPFAFASH